MHAHCACCSCSSRKYILRCNACLTVIATFVVTPTNGPEAGGNVVTITSAEILGDGQDVTLVQLCGNDAKAIISQTSNQVVVEVGAGPQKLTPCLINIFSESRGETQARDGYTYNKRM